MSATNVDIDINARNKTKVAFARVNEDLKRINKNTQFLKNSMVGLAGSYLALRTVGSVINSHREFTKAVSNLSAITGITGDNLQALSNRTREMGKVTTLSASQAAEAFKLVASAQPQLIQQAGALDLVTTATVTLAEAASIDLPDAAKSLTLALNQYGASAGEAAKFVDVLAAGAKYGSSEITQTSEALVSAGLVAKSAGTSFAELNASIQVLAKSGVKGREAGTGLRNVYLNLAKQTKSQFKPAVVGLTQALKNLRDAQLSEVQLLDIFGKKNIVAAKALIGNAQAMDGLTVNLNENGVASEQARINVDNLDGDIKRLGSAFEELQLIIGNNSNGALRGFVNVLTDIVTPSTVAYEVTRTLISALAGLAMAKVAAVVFTTLRAATTLLSATFSQASIAAWTLRSALKPISLILVGVTAAFTAFNLTTTDAIDKTGELNMRVETLLGNYQTLRISETENAIVDLTAAIEQQRQAIVDYQAFNTAGGSPLSDTARNVMFDMAQVAAKYGAQIQALTEKLRALKDEANNTTLTSSTTGENPETDSQEEAQRARLKARLARQLADIQNALLNEEERLNVSLDKRYFMVEDAYTRDLISLQTKNELQEQLEVEHQRKFNAIKRKGMTDAMRFADDIRQGEYRSAIQMATQLTAGLASSSKDAFELNKAAGISNAVINTYQGITKALAELPPPYSFVAAGITAAHGFAQVRAIQSRQFGSGNGTAPSLAGSGRGGSQTVNTLPNQSAFIQSEKQTQTRTTQIIFTGDVYGVDDFSEKVTDIIKEAVNERDIVIVNADSRQAQEIREGI